MAKLGKLADIVKTVASASKSSKSTTSSSTKTVKKASSSSSGSSDLITSLIKGALSADNVKTLAKQANDDDDGILDNAGTILKKLLSTKTESATGDVDKDELHDEIDILKKIMPSKLSSSNLTTIVKKVIASLDDDDKNEDNVLDILKGFKNIDLGSVTSIVKKLL
jgi:uncharacterized protein YqeY